MPGVKQQWWIDAEENQSLQCVYVHQQQPRHPSLPPQDAHVLVRLLQRFQELLEAPEASLKAARFDYTKVRTCRWHAAACCMCKCMWSQQQASIRQHLPHLSSQRRQHSSYAA